MNPHSSSKARIAVIGAGMTGIGCANCLRQHGFHPTIFEKSRGLGGRLATRSVGDGIAFDHGAQYITARSATFQSLVKEAIKTSAADHWRPKGFDRAPALADDWIVGTPGMNALVKPFAHGIDIRLATEVTGIDREGDIWRVHTQTNEIGEPFDIVVSSAPAPQARVLLASEPKIAEALAKVSIAPCWALMLAFGTPFDPGFDVWQSDEDDFAWISHNSSRPCRRTAKDCWVVHASPEWSERYLELDRARVAEMMIEMLPPAFGDCLPEIDHASAHRWRFARTTAPLGETYLYSRDRTLFVGGETLDSAERN